MATKLGRKEYPSGHNEDDFKCFGPPATKDGEFEGTLIADLGCFTQDGKDSNKFYHAAVVQSKKDDAWYVYFEWGRTGAGSQDFQFTQCGDKSEAEIEYSKQLHKKNDKRGEWHDHPMLGKILRAKAGKDCYLVRPQATRSTGLSDAKTIKCSDGVDETKKSNGNSKKSKPIKKGPTADRQTTKLMNDLRVATISYTRGAMADNAIPTQVAIDEARDILGAAMKQVGRVGDDIDSQVKDSELNDLTRLMYSRIPKKKDRNAEPEEWILSQGNIMLWQQDLDAFESALYASDTDLGDNEQEDPFGGMNLRMEYLDPKSDRGKFIIDWAPNATLNRHGWVDRMKIKNVWHVERNDDATRFPVAQARIVKDRPITREKALHQPKRTDLSTADAKLAVQSNTALMFHGTRSVNVSGILREALRMPRQLVGVIITGAMFGPGLYFADDWKKSAGYCSLRGSYWSGGDGRVKDRGAFMFVCDVAVGKPHVANGPSGYTAPPSGCHSVFGKAGYSRVQNNEWIVYKAEQNRLRYLIEFDT